MNPMNFIAALLAVFELDACQRPTRQSSMGEMMRAMNAISSSGRGKGEMTQKMGSADHTDMQIYMEMFQRHLDIRRSVQQLKGGVRTLTESTNRWYNCLIAIARFENVSSRRARAGSSLHERQPAYDASALITISATAGMTPHGVAAEETSDDGGAGRDPRHADEVSARSCARGCRR